MNMFSKFRRARAYLGSVIGLLLHHLPNFNESNTLGRYSVDVASNPFGFTQNEWLAGGFDWHNADESIVLSIHGSPSRMGPSAHNHIGSIYYDGFSGSSSYNEPPADYWPGMVYCWKGDLRVVLPDLTTISVHESRDIFHAGAIHSVAPKPVYGTAITNAPDGTQWLIAICADSIDMNGNSPTWEYMRNHVLSWDQNRYLTYVVKHEVYAKPFAADDTEWQKIGEKTWSDSALTYYYIYEHQYPVGPDDGYGIASARMAFEGYTTGPALVSRNQHNWHFKQDGSEAVARMAENTSGFTGVWDDQDPLPDWPLVEGRITCSIAFESSIPVASFGSFVEAWSVTTDFFGNSENIFTHPVFYNKRIETTDYLTGPASAGASTAANSTLTTDYIDGFDYDAQGRLLVHRRRETRIQAFINKVTPSNYRRYESEHPTKDESYWADLYDLNYSFEEESNTERRAWIEVVSSGQVLMDHIGGTTNSQVKTAMIGPNIYNSETEQMEQPYDPGSGTGLSTEKLSAAQFKPCAIDLRRLLATYKGRVSLSTFLRGVNWVVIDSVKKYAAVIWPEANHGEDAGDIEVTNSYSYTPPLIGNPNVVPLYQNILYVSSLYHTWLVPYPGWGSEDDNTTFTFIRGNRGTFGGYIQPGTYPETLTPYTTKTPYAQEILYNGEQMQVIEKGGAMIFSVRSNAANFTNKFTEGGFLGRTVASTSGSLTPLTQTINGEMSITHRG